MGSTYRFLRQYLRQPPGIVESVELGHVRNGRELEATLHRPAGPLRRLPGWIVLHGLTTSGRRHASLVPFAQALAASGSAVFIPDVPEWRALRVAPAVTGATIRAALDALEASGATEPGRVGVFGFSFGATQALVASTEDRELEERIAAIAAWGGYCDLDRLFLFGLTGEHELDGVVYSDEPDPYGRWIMGANYLTRIPGYEARAGAARALHELALESGRIGTAATDPIYDPVKEALAGGLDPADRAVFELFAPRTTDPAPERDAGQEIALALAAAGRRTDPILDPAAHLPRLRVPTLLAHGRGDRLVPFTEGIRLQRALPPGVCRRCTVTALFAHSSGERRLGPLEMARESARFLGLLNRILDLV